MYDIHTYAPNINIVKLPKLLPNYGGNKRPYQYINLIYNSIITRLLYGGNTSLRPNIYQPFIQIYLYTTFPWWQQRRRWVAVMGFSPLCYITVNWSSLIHDSTNPSGRAPINALFVIDNNCILASSAPELPNSCCCKLTSIAG